MNKNFENEDEDKNNIIDDKNDQEALEKDENQNSSEEKYNEVNDKYIRLLADFENFRRRKSTEILETISTANKKLILKILPIVDDFERYFETEDSNKENLSKTSSEGINHIYKKLINILQKEGLSEIKIKKGDNFDSENSEAITKIKTKENLSNKIVEIVEKGYMLNNKIIRFAKVIIGE